MNSNEKLDKEEKIQDRIRKVISGNKEFSLDVAKVEIGNILNSEVEIINDMRDVDGE